MVGDEHRARRFPIWSELGSTTARPEYWPSSCWQVTSLTTLLLYLTLFLAPKFQIPAWGAIVKIDNWLIRYWLCTILLIVTIPVNFLYSARSSFGILAPNIYLRSRVYASFHCFASVFPFVMPHIFVFAQRIPPDLVLVWWLSVLRCIVWILVQTSSGRFTIFRFHYNIVGCSMSIFFC